MSYPNTLNVSREITFRAKLIKRTTPLIGAMAVILIYLAVFNDKGTWFEGVLGLSMLVFIYSTRSIANHFNVSLFDCSFVVFDKLENYPPLNKWLVADDTKEISQAHYDEIERLMMDVRVPYIEERMKQVLVYRDGIMTYYDFANLVFMYESHMRLQQHNRKKR